MNGARLRRGVAGAGTVVGLSLGLLPAGPAQAQEQVPCNDVPALKAAIKRANGNDGVVVLAPGCTYRLMVADGGEDGLPSITGKVRISSSNATITRTSLWPFRILHVAEGGALTLERTTISGGLATRGGGVLSESGTLTLTDVTIEKSRSLGQGGGIDNEGGVLTMRRGFLRDNSAGQNGGGLENRTVGAVTLSDVSITGNTSGGWGGGIDNGSTSALSLIGSTASGNRATRGGGLSNADSAATVLNSRITGNTATSEEGGGGIYGFSGTVKLVSGSVTGNTPDDCAPAGNVAGCAGTGTR